MTPKPYRFVFWILAIGLMLNVPAGQAEAARPARAQAFLGVQCKATGGIHDLITALWPNRWKNLTAYTGGVPGGGPYPGVSVSPKQLPLPILSCDDLRQEVLKAKPGDVITVYTYPPDNPVYIAYGIRLIPRPASAGKDWF